MEISRIPPRPYFHYSVGAMFLFSWRGVVGTLVLFTIYAYLLVKGGHDAVTPWIDGTMIVLIAYLFIRTWFG